MLVPVFGSLEELHLKLYMLLLKRANKFPSHLHEINIKSVPYFMCWQIFCRYCNKSEMKIALDISSSFPFKQENSFCHLNKGADFLIFWKNVLRFTPRYILLPVFTIYLHSTVEQFGIVTAIIELYWEGICWVVDVAKPPRRISTS